MSASWRPTCGRSSHASDELAVGFDESPLAVRLVNIASGRFVEPEHAGSNSPDRPLESNWRIVTGDGVLDAISSSTMVEFVSVSPGRGDTTFGKAIAVDVGGTSPHASVADMNGHGLADIVTGNFHSGTVSVLINQGSAGGRYTGRMLVKLMLIAVGGAVGALLRFAISTWAQELIKGNFPLGTLLVNTIGCFAIGICAAYFSGPILMREELRPAIVIGLLGAFTTFSTFGYETFELMNEKQFTAAGLNVLLSNTLGLAGVWCGYRLSQMMGFGG